MAEKAGHRDAGLIYAVTSYSSDKCRKIIHLHPLNGNSFFHEFAPFALDNDFKREYEYAINAILYKNFVTYKDICHK